MDQYHTISQALLACILPYSQSTNNFPKEPFQDGGLTQKFDATSIQELLTTITTNHNILDQHITSYMGMGFCTNCDPKKNQHTKVINSDKILDILNHDILQQVFHRKVLSGEIPSHFIYLTLCLKCAKYILLSPTPDQVISEVSQRLIDDDSLNHDPSRDVFHKQSWSLYYDSFSDNV